MKYEGLEYTSDVERTIEGFGQIEKGTIISKAKHPKLCEGLEGRIGIDFEVVEKVDPKKAVAANSAAGRGESLEDFKP